MAKATLRDQVQQADQHIKELPERVRRLAHFEGQNYDRDVVSIIARSTPKKRSASRDKEKIDH